jgi:hypothetical protein
VVALRRPGRRHRLGDPQAPPVGGLEHLGELAPLGVDPVNDLEASAGAGHAVGDGEGHSPGGRLVLWDRTGREPFLVPLPLQLPHRLGVDETVGQQRPSGLPLSVPRRRIDPVVGRADRTAIVLELEDIDGDGVPDVVVGRAVAEPPRLVPRSVGGMVGFEQIRAGVRVRLERVR